MEMDDAYKKACKRAEAKGRQSPARDQYYYGEFPITYHPVKFYAHVMT